MNKRRRRKQDKKRFEKLVSGTAMWPYGRKFSYRRSPRHRQITKYRKKRDLSRSVHYSYADCENTMELYIIMEEIGGEANEQETKEKESHYDQSTKQLLETDT
jgi:hypothetical protein